MTREPLILLHGIGSFRHVWDPVVPHLERERQVHALDLPGFGDAPPLPAGEEPSPEALARAIARELDARGLDTVHAAGNSLGGWVSLELAKLGRTRSVCALSPAGFWRGWERTFCAASLRNARALSKALLPVVDTISANAALRRIALAQFAARADRMTPAQAAASSRNLALCPGWSATLKAMSAREFTGGEQVQGPVTIAWAEKDRLLLPRQAERARAALPKARHIVLTGCGHVPTYDDPELVARAILSSA
jgi:pimeloyl-ACP methyl ester carboxylesterase